MNKKIVSILLVLVVVLAIGYFSLRKTSKVIPISEVVPVAVQPLTVTQQNNTLPQTPVQPPIIKPTVTTISTWKTFSEGTISISAPAGFQKLSSPTESGTVLMIGPGHEEVGSISILKYSSKEVYEKETDRPKETPIDAHYLVNGVPGVLYVDKDGDSSYTFSIIDIPSRNAFIMIAPSPKEWPSVSEADVNKIIQSIKF